MTIYPELISSLLQMFSVLFPPAEFEVAAKYENNPCKSDGNLI